MTKPRSPRYNQGVTPTLSNRSFGTQMSCVLGIITLVGLTYSWPIEVLGVLCFASLSCLFTTIFFDQFLKYPKKIWMGLGVLLGRVFSPIILAGIFFILFTPIGVFRRLLGKDVLMLKKNESQTFWKIRQEKQFSRSAFFNQY